MRIKTVLVILLWIASSASATVLNVGVEGSQEAYTNIQAAIDVAQGGDVIILHPGIHTGWGNIDITIDLPLTLRSLDPNDPNCVRATVIDCQYLPQRALTLDCKRAKGPVMIAGLTFQNGYAERGGAIQCINMGDYHLKQCIFRYNSALKGGAVYLLTNTTQTECLFIGNTAQYGGAIHSDGRCRVNRCRFFGNTARMEGGAFNAWTTGIINESVFIGNTAEIRGGAIAARGELFQLYGSTLVGNHAGQQASAINLSGRPDEKPYDIKDCIIWANQVGNSLDFPLLAPQEDTTVTYCCIQDETPQDNSIPFGGAEAHNIDDDPLFVRLPHDGGDGWLDNPSTPGIDEGLNNDYGDLHLRPDSPCVEAGTPLNWLRPRTQDMDGQPRLMGQYQDMGADEFYRALLEVTNPDEQAVSTAGSVQQVHWQSHLYKGPVDVHLSTDGGMTWQRLKQEVANTGATTCLVPEHIDSQTCLLQVLPSDQAFPAWSLPGGPFTIKTYVPDVDRSAYWPTLGGNSQHQGQTATEAGSILGVLSTVITSGPIQTSPTIGADHAIHVACSDGKLYTFDPNGVTLWEFAADSALTTSPTVGRDGGLYVGSASGELYAVDRAGQLRWTFQTGAPIHASPALSPEGDVYVGSLDGTLYALGKDGSLIWTFKTQGPASLPGAIAASAAVGPDGTVYVAGLYDPNLYALDPLQGTPKWASAFSPGTRAYAAPVVAQDGTIYLGRVHDSYLYAVDHGSGEIKWATDLAPAQEPGDANGPGLFYPDTNSAWSEPVVGPDGTIYVGLDDGAIRAVDPNGTIQWQKQLEDSGTFTLVADHWGRLFAASERGTLHGPHPWRPGEMTPLFQLSQRLNYPVIGPQGRVMVAGAGDPVKGSDTKEGFLWVLGKVEQY